MRPYLLKFFITLALATLCSANLADNQIDDEQDQYVLTRGRYNIRACTPCRQNQCQVMGMQRFSEPRCEALGGLGAPCRPFQEAENKSLSFPNMVLYCDQVYMQFCPCARGLVCDLQDTECRYPHRETPSTWRPRQESRQQDSFAISYVEPERYTSDEGFDDVEVGGESAPVVYEPIYQRQESLTIRRRPQWVP